MILPPSALSSPFSSVRPLRCAMSDIIHEHADVSPSMHTAPTCSNPLVMAEVFWTFMFERSVIFLHTGHSDGVRSDWNGTVLMRCPSEQCMAYCSVIGGTIGTPGGTSPVEGLIRLGHQPWATRVHVSNESDPSARSRVRMRNTCMMPFCMRAWTLAGKPPPSEEDKRVTLR